MKIKLSKTDILFSQYVRLLADGECQRCHKQIGFKKLQCAHFHGRRKRSVRWDRLNVTALCFACHQYLDSEAMEKVEFFMNRMTRKEFNDLNRRAETIRKWTPQELGDLEADLKSKIKKLEGE